MAELRLVIFDVDGTLVDSQNDIVAAMGAAFRALDHDTPSRAEVLGIVGLSLDAAMERLSPALYATHGAALVEGYKTAFMTMRQSKPSAQTSPLYPRARAAIERLAAQEHVLLGIATGKSRRGLDHLLDAHDLRRYFMTAQVADDHPSKPHPSMLEQCLRDAGVDARQAVMVGDTTFDMQMGVNAGMPTVGVDWGYHETDALRAHTGVIISGFDALDAALERIWEAVP